MEVDEISFQAHLLDILVAIGKAHFVSFDLELSGVPVKAPGAAAGRPSLQQRYLETKRAAEQFQILQIGLTCVSEEDDRGVYECKPYNINLSPVIDEKQLDIDRTFSFHSGAVAFLLSVGFRLDLPFTSGVPYLSRSEAKKAEELAAARNDRTAVSDIQIKATDTQSLELLSQVRAEIARWRKDGSASSYLIISPAEVGDGSRSPSAELSRFERRLIHQLVRAEYPDLVTTPYRGHIRIMHLDEERENRIRQQRLRETKQRIDRQSGFRWIIEALCGNAPTHIDPISFGVDPQTGQAVVFDLGITRSLYYQAQKSIQGKKTILVGHNMFLDMVYLYRTFIGDLPDTVEEFTKLIHELFPVIIDTKYMATHNCGDINPASSLQETAELLAFQEHPRMENHPSHTKYEETTAFHEAGYDSLLTAQIAVRLSAKLEAAGTYIEDDKDADIPSSPDETTGGVALHGDAADFKPGDSNPPNRSPRHDGEISSLRSAINGVGNLLLAPVKALSGEPKTVARSSKSKRPTPQKTTGSSSTNLENVQPESSSASDSSVKARAEARQKKQEAKRTGGRFAHATAFDGLQDIEDLDEDDGEEEILQFDDISASVHGSAPTVTDTDEISDQRMEEIWPSTPPWRQEAGKAMPRFDSDFWKVYGNKLRVFGTQEGVCLLE